MDLKRVRELIKLVAESDVAELEVEEGGVKIVVRKSQPVIAFHGGGMPMFPYGMPALGPAMPAPAHPVAPPVDPAGSGPPLPAAAAVPAAPAVVPPAAEVRAGTLVRAPIVGTFYRSAAPDSPAFVEIGDRVKVGDTLCIIEAMKLMNEIEAEISGTVTEVMLENGRPVEFDQPLFFISPA